jgi:manganese/iron transport system permease protein
MTSSLLCTERMWPDMLRVLTDPWSYAFFPRALVACVVVMVLGALAGVSVRSQRQVYLGQGVGQSMLAGAAAASLAGVDGFVASALSALVAAGAVAWLARDRRTGVDVAIAVVASTLLALGVAALSIGRSQAVNTTNLLFGNVLGATWPQILISALVAVGAGTFFITQARRLALIGLSPAVAAAHGIPVRRLEVVQIVMVALSVATFVQVAGTLLAIVALVVPTAVAHYWSRSILGLHAVGVGVGAVAAVVGLYVSYWSDVPSGPALTLTAATMYVVSAVVLRRR